MNKVLSVVFMAGLLFSVSGVILAQEDTDFVELKSSSNDSQTKTYLIRLEEAKKSSTIS